MRGFGRVCLLVVAVVWLGAVPAAAQVFWAPTGYTVVPFANNDEVSKAVGHSPWFDGHFPTCAGGPDFQITIAIPDDGVWAVSSGYLPNRPLAWPMVTVEALGAALPGAPEVKVRVVEWSPYTDYYYAALMTGQQQGMDSVLVEFDRFGDVRLVLLAEEMAPYAESYLQPSFLRAAPDGTLWVTLDGLVPTLLHVDPEAAEGQRILGSWTGAELAALFPGVTGLDLPAHFAWTGAADDQGRFFLAASVYDEYPGTPRLGLYRFNADGTVTDMSVQEGDKGPWSVEVAQATRGIHWDERSGLLVALGEGVMGFNPDRPGWSSVIVPGYELTGRMLAYQDDAGPGAAGGPNDICSGPTSWQGSSAFVAFHQSVYYLTSFDPLLMDLDLDLLTGSEEEKLGTDPLWEDTDGGGIEDGIERMDYTDPLNGDDDRLLPQPPEDWTMIPFSVGSEAWTEMKYGIHRRVLAHPGGELRIVSDSQDVPYNRLYRWRGPDIPAWLTVQKGAEEYTAMAPDGFLYGFWPDMGIVRTAPPGADVAAVESVIDPGELEGLVGEQFTVSGIAVTPDRHVYATFPKGKLIRVDPDGHGELIYDGWADALLAGLMEENGMSGGCNVDVPMGPVTYEPVRGIVYFWVNLSIYCGQGVGFLSTVLMAVEPDGTMRYIAHGNLFEETESMYGAISPKDMEPDMTGGLWVLGSSSLDRLLYRLDPNFNPHSVMELQGPGLWGGTGVQGTTTALAHAYDMAVTPDGSVYIMPMYYYYQSPPQFMLAQLAPVEPRVKAGEYLLLNPEFATLARLLPLGGGMNLLSGEPFQHPVGVAATENRVAVADDGRKEVLFFDVAADGSLGDFQAVGPIETPAGLDLDGEGRAVVADRGAARVLRVAADGTVEALAEGGDLVEPMDVVCLADGSTLVADRGGSGLFRIDSDGGVDLAAAINGPVAVAVAGGTVYASAAGEGIPFAYRLGSSGWDFLGHDGDLPPRADYTVPGGIAAMADGTVVWMAMTRPLYDKPFDTRFQPSASETYPIRFNPRGYATVMVRNGMGPTADPCDVALVRAVSDPLPSLNEPGTEGGTEQPAVDGEEPPCAESGGCAAAGTEGRGAWFLLALLVLLAALRWRFRAGSLLTVLVAVALVVPACGGKKDCAPLPADVTADSTGADARSGPGTSTPARPDDPVYFPECPDAPCVPGAEPECVDGGSRKRCLLVEDGCPSWSPVQACLAGTSCVDGRCEGCVPDCFARECGDNGCGGSCGDCAAEDCCNGGHCMLCAPDCEGKECGPDWAGGGCGECEAGEVCASGQCHKPGSGSCYELEGCLGDCPPWDDFCWDDCQAFPLPLALYQLEQLHSCAMVLCRHCWEGEADQACYAKCLQSACLEPLALCQNAMGYASCSEAYDCIGQCEEEDWECGEACILVMTPQAYIAAIEWGACMLPLCPDGLPEAELEACEAEAAAGPCADVHVACFGPCEPWCAPGQECGSDSCTGACGICPEGSWCANGHKCSPL